MAEALLTTVQVKLLTARRWRRRRRGAPRTARRRGCRAPIGVVEALEFTNNDGAAPFVLNVQLRRGTLWVPCLCVDSITWMVLRNIMALDKSRREQ